MPGHPDEQSGDRLTTSEQQLLLSLPSDDVMATQTSTTTTTNSSSSTAQQRHDQKRREAEADVAAPAPASERWGVQAYAALSSSLMTGQSIAAASFGSIAVDHIQQGYSPVVASDAQLTFFLTSHFVGMTLGSLVSGVLGQRFGSRTLMLATLPLSLLAWVTIGLAPSIAVMTSGRIVLGFATLVQMSSNVFFISATSGPKYRGLLCNSMEVMVAVATTATFLTGKYLVWRYSAVALGLGFNVLAACLLAPLPADPLFLLSRGRLEDARRALLFYRGADADMSGIKERATEAAGDQQRVDTSVLEKLRLLRQRSHYLPVLLLVVMFVMHTWSGAGVVQNFAVVFIRRVGITMDPFTLTIAMAVGRLPVTVINSLLVDRWGRRPLLLTSSLGMAVCHIAMAAYFLCPALSEHTWLPVASLFGCMSFFAIGACPITWVLMGELLPRSLRELCGGWLMVLYTLLTVAQLQVFPAMLAALGEAGVFLFWAAVALLHVLFVITMLPETRGLDIEQIERLFASRQVAKATGLAARVAMVTLPPPPPMPPYEV